MKRTASKQRLRLWLRLLRTTRAVEGELRERLRQRYSTTLPRFDVMAALSRDSGGITMGALSRALLVSNGNVTGIVDRLVGDGLVERVSVVGDRRATQVRLTARGRRQFMRMAREHEAWVDELFASIGAREVDELIAPLDRFRQVQTKNRVRSEST